jgi:hypothetical protein
VRSSHTLIDQSARNRGERDVVGFLIQLRDVLTWTDPQRIETVRQIALAFQNHLLNLIEPASYSWAETDPTATELFMSTFKQLDDDSMAKLIRLPEVASMILKPILAANEGHRLLLLHLLLSMGGGMRDSSARGDLSSSPRTAFCALDEFEWGYRKHIVTSFKGPLVIPPMERGGNSIVGMTTTQTRKLLPKLGAASCLISRASTMVHEFVFLNTDHLAFRQETEFPRSCSSGSFRDLPGLALLCNYHRRATSEFQLAEAVVHEATHAIIYRFESLGCRLVRESRADIRIPSPWTGAKISLDSFCQACMVWFGLYHLAGRTAGHESELLRKRTAAGFFSPSFTNCCNDIASYLHEGVPEFLKDLPNHIDNPTP